MAALAKVPRPRTRTRNRYGPRVAVDEASHAQLAWDVLRWTIKKGGDDVKHAVFACKDTAPNEISSMDLPKLTTSLSSVS